MDLTPTTILAVASGFVLLCTAAEKAYKIYQAAKAPNARQNDELKDLKARVEKIEGKLDNDNEHLQTIDTDNRITQRALLALLDHGIDGNNIEQMQHAKEELQNHLINR